jgi:hypothetical protein
MYAMYYASMLQCWQLVRILVGTNYPCLSVGCHTGKAPLPTATTGQDSVRQEAFSPRLMAAGHRTVQGVG